MDIDFIIHITDQLMKLEIKLDKKFVKEIKREPFEFEILEVNNDQLKKMDFVAKRIETLIKDMFCFRHPESRVLVTVRWSFEYSEPEISILSCCPTFIERLQMILFNNHLFSDGSYLRILDEPTKN